MARRVDDTEDRPPGRHPAARHPEVEAAEFEAEQPARDLSGTPKLIISAAAVAVSRTPCSGWCGPSRPSPTGPRSWPSPWP